MKPRAPFPVALLVAVLALGCLAAPAPAQDKTPTPTPERVPILLDTEVSSAGLSTIVLPPASAGLSFQASMSNGEFHGTIAPTTPTGSRRV